MIIRDAERDREKQTEKMSAFWRVRERYIVRDSKINYIYRFNFIYLFLYFHNTI